MPDAFLYAMMQGLLVPNKIKTKGSFMSRFDLAIDKAIEGHLDSLSFEELNPHNLQLLSHNVLKEKFRIELQEALKLPDLDHQIGKAFTFLYSTGRQLLDDAQYEATIADFSRIVSEIEKWELDSTSREESFELPRVNNATAKALMAMTTVLYADEKYEECLAILCLLLTFFPGNADYWYRSAIAAQQCHRDDFALMAYEATMALDSNHLGARIFAAECYFNAGLQDKAFAAYEEAQEIAKNNVIGDEWHQLLNQLKEVLKSAA